MITIILTDRKEPAPARTIGYGKTQLEALDGAIMHLITEYGDQVADLAKQIYEHPELNQFHTAINGSLITLNVDTLPARGYHQDPLLQTILTADDGPTITLFLLADDYGFGGFAKAGKSLMPLSYNDRWYLSKDKSAFEEQSLDHVLHRINTWHRENTEILKAKAPPIRGKFDITQRSGPIARQDASSLSPRLREEEQTPLGRQALFWMQQHWNNLH